MKRLLFCLIVVSTPNAFALAGPYYGPLRCVPRCETRYLDGQCARSAPDFCGYGAKCIPKCDERYVDGQCARWGADFCGYEGYRGPAWAPANR
jgi:hypothetical protein